MRKNAMILAAGMGTRMGELTADRTKALLEINGETLLSRMVTFLRAVGEFEHIAVVGGFCFEKTEAEAKRIDPSITTIENPAYTDQNLVSFAKGIEVVTEGDIFVVNVDYIFSNSTARATKESLGTTAVYCSYDLSGNEEDVMKVVVEDGTLAIMAKEIQEFQAIYTGMFYLEERHLRLVRECIPSIWNKVGKKDATVEHLFPALKEQDVSISVKDVGSADWFEIDTPEELARAQKAF